MTERTQVALVAVTVTAIIALALMSYVVVSRTTPVQNTISVTGTGNILVVPDQLVVNLAVESRAASASAALQTNSQLMNSVIASLTQAGLSKSELSTSSVQVQPLYNNSRDATVIVGYAASNAITISTNKTGSAGQFIDAGVSAGANRVNFAYFTVSDSMQGRVRERLISMAVANATTEATGALSPLGLKIVGVQSMSISGTGVPIFGRTDQVSAATPILPGQQTISASVQVVFLVGR